MFREIENLPIKKITFSDLEKYKKDKSLDRNDLSCLFPDNEKTYAISGNKDFVVVRNISNTGEIVFHIYKRWDYIKASHIFAKKNSIY